jgi:hypothetical protein
MTPAQILAASVGYYTERESPMGWALFAAPGDNGYPSRFVAHLDSPCKAQRCADVLGYIASQHGAATARECERTAVEVAR